MLPSNPLELHWPSRICVNKQGILCTNDDFTKGIKCIDSSTNEYISHLDCRESFPELEFVNPTDICCLDNNVICFIDQNHTNQLYTIRDKTCLVLYKGNTQSQFNQIMAFNDSVYALDKYNQTLTQISAEGKVIQTRTFSEKYNSIHSFYIDSSALYLLNKNGMLYITPFRTKKKQLKFNFRIFKIGKLVSSFLFPYKIELSSVIETTAVWSFTALFLVEISLNLAQLVDLTPMFKTQIPKLIYGTKLENFCFQRKFYYLIISFLLPIPEISGSKRFLLIRFWKQ